MSQGTTNPPAMESTSGADLARSITRAGSSQTYRIIRWLADRDLRADAYRAYAYFRWLDDQIDGEALSRGERLALLHRQRGLLAYAARGDASAAPGPEEQLLLDLLERERRAHPGLRSYLHHMMNVMAFDAARRGETVSAQELTAYSRHLSRAVMDGLSYFVGHDVVYPQTPDRLLAVTGAHIVHMLRDASADVRTGYYNVPREFLDAHRLAPQDLQAAGYREWVRQRLQLARRCFSLGRGYITSFRNLRVRLAGMAYCGRFEGILRRLETNGRGPDPAEASERLASGSPDPSARALGRGRLLRSSRPRMDETP
jgi:phytoene/squalene synthetase